MTQQEIIEFLQINRIVSPEKAKSKNEIIRASGLPEPTIATALRRLIRNRTVDAYYDGKKMRYYLLP